jgi:hypothetical protein
MMADQEQPVFELSDDERRHLSYVLKHPGHEVLKKIQRAYIDAVKGSALAISTSDPLGNKDEVLKQWTYVAVAEEFIRQVENGVSFELTVLNKHEAPPADPTETARKRRLHRMSGSLSPLPE